MAIVAFSYYAFLILADHNVLLLLIVNEIPVVSLSSTEQTNALSVATPILIHFAFSTSLTCGFNNGSSPSYINVPLSFRPIVISDLALAIPRANLNLAYVTHQY